MSAGAFEYRALGSDGATIRGTVVADSAGEAAASLERDGLLPVSLEPTQLASVRAKLSLDDAALGIRMLADFVQAGLSVPRALQSLESVGPGSWQLVLPEIRRAVGEGKSLAASLRVASTISPVAIGIVAASEGNGDVAAALARAASVLESEAQTRAAIRAALAYPALLLVTATGAIAMMMTIVIPRFATILADVGQSLPMSTRIVMGAANVSRHAFVPAIVGLVLLALAHRAWTSNDRGLRQWHHLLLGIPLVGNIRSANATSRLSLTVASLLESGVPLRQALRLGGSAAGDAEVASRVEFAAAKIEAGQSLTGAMRDARALSALGTKLLQAGEESGRVSVMLRHAARLEHERGERLTRSAVRLIEPALILSLAGVVALVAAALLQAVYAVKPT